jgi:hypothetical protein
MIVQTIATIQLDICSFGNPAISKPHWFQIYPSLFQFDYLALKLKTTVLAPSPSYFRYPLHESADLPISTSKPYFGAILY